jgi:hypothetical protein
MTVVKVLEVVGASEKDWQSAVATAVSEASKTVANIKGVEVVNWTAGVNGDKITQFKANCKIAYVE